MNNTIIKIVICCTLTTACYSAFAQNPSHTLIPEPVSFSAGIDSFELKSNCKIIFDTKIKNAQLAANFFIRAISKPTGFKLSFEKMPLPDSKGDINIQFDKNLKEEAYTLDVSKKQITIKAKTGAGAFYAFQTLLQMMPVEVFASKKANLLVWKIPAASVSDEPRFSYRGMHLDCSRHLFHIDFIKRYLDLMALHKYNTFHWHLTDDQGWRIEIKKYPKLTQVGGFRKQTCSPNALSSEAVCDGMRYGGFYTQAQIKEIVKYAADRFITIIPEIEMPGHASAAIAAYPWLACKDSTYETATTWGVFDNVMCPSEKTFTFIQDVLTEVMQLFPSKYIHIGGDEVPKIRWKESKLCQDIMTKEKLKNEAELQSYLVNRVEKFLISRGRKLIGWDEILEGGISPDATIMSWRGTEGGITAAKSKHYAIMTPGSHCYFDHYQSLSPQEPFAQGGFTTVEKVYSYEPIPENLTDSEAIYILGAQGNVWTEYIEFPRHIEYMVYPRASALSEVLWSSKQKRNYSLFLNRLIHHFKRLDQLKVNYARHVSDVNGIISNNNNGSLLLKMYSNIDSASIYYSLDGSKVSTTSNQYNQPLEINSSCTIKAATFRNGVKLGNEYEQNITIHKGIKASVALTYQPASQYKCEGAQTLINGITGSANYGDNQWLGFSGNNAEVVLDFKTATAITKIRFNYLVKNDSWIYSPKAVLISGSQDGINYTSVSQTDLASNQENKRINVFEASFATATYRYMKIVVVNTPLIDDGQPGAGHPAWLFIDEIVVE